MKWKCRESILQSLDAEVKRDVPNLRVKPGRNCVGRRNLFVYRVFQPASESKVDPVVVGVVCSPGENGFMVRGDIAGEIIGDILFEVPDKEVIGRLATLEAVRDTAERLAANAFTVALALRQEQRAID